MTMMELLKKSLIFVGLMTILSGIIYPLLVTGFAQALFPHQANGSIMEKDGKPIGSELIGQSFAEPGYFWPRPSLTDPVPYHGASSSGSNKTPAGEEMSSIVQERIQKLQAADPENNQKIPVDLVTASASGLDPHLSPAAALYQVERVARTRGLEPEVVYELVERHTEQRLFGILGEPRINVLKLNRALNER